MKILRILWKILSRDERRALLSGLNVLDRQYCNDFVNNKHLPDCFLSTKSLFIHIPKCAGSSMVRAIYGDKAGGHRTVRWYQNQFPNEYEIFFTFSTVRNPWDRLVSAWNYLCREDLPKRDREWQKLLKKFDSFDTFVRNWVCSENIVKQIHFCPQTDFLLDNQGIISLDYVDRVECINTAFDLIRKKVGSKSSLQVLHRSRSDDYREYYTDQTRERVAQVYQRDIELLGYHFEGYYKDSLPQTLF